MWYADSKWQGRMLAERQIMESRFPHFRLVRTDLGALQWVGVLRPIEDAEFVTVVQYPDRYPYSAPKLFVVDPPLRTDAPHVYHDGSVCIHKRQWDAECGTAASCVPLLASWLVAYVNWIRTGERF